MRLYKAIVQTVQPVSQVFNLLIGGGIADLRPPELGKGVADTDHAGDALLGRFVRERHRLRGRLADMIGGAQMD
ncbi:hypothetical protein D3C87_1609040 [compost metagenome]